MEGGVGGGRGEGGGGQGMGRVTIAQELGQTRHFLQSQQVPNYTKDSVLHFIAI